MILRCLERLKPYCGYYSTGYGVVNSGIHYDFQYQYPNPAMSDHAMSTVHPLQSSLHTDYPDTLFAFSSRPASNHPTPAILG